MAHQILNNLESSLSSTVKDIQKIKSVRVEHMLAHICVIFDRELCVQSLATKRQEEIAANAAALSHNASESQVVWEVHFSDEYQRSYYYNVSTGESRWDMPTSGTIVDYSVNESSNHEAGQPQTADLQYLHLPQEQEYQQRQQQRQQGYQHLSSSSPNSRGRVGRINSDQADQAQEYSVINSPDNSQATAATSNYANVMSETSPSGDSNSQFSFEQAQQYRNPSSNTNNRNVSAVKKKTIAERSAEQLQLKKEKEENLRSFLQQKSLEEVRSAPEITSKSKQLVKARKVDDMLAWDESRKAKIENLKQQQQQQLEKQHTGKPQLKPSNSSSNRDSTAPHQPVHERLLEQGEQRRLKQQYLQEKADEEARLNAVPRIVSTHTIASSNYGGPSSYSSQYGSQPQQQQPVQERLYSIARQQQQQQRQFDDGGVGNYDNAGPVYHDPNTGQRLFQVPRELLRFYCWLLYI
jgi:hypothetical protein